MNEGVSERPSKGRYENLAVRARLENAGEATEKDAGVGADPRLGVDLGFGEEAEEVVVEDSFGEL